jgi:uncharacterized phage protein (TIGR01671 family)
VVIKLVSFINPQCWEGGIKVRETKFRAWDKNAEVMCTVVKIDFKGELAHLEFTHKNDKVYGDPAVSFDKLEFMQYTGLDDKNGKGIYEGDTVYFNDFSYDRTGGHVDNNILTGKIHFDSGMYLIGTKKGHYTLCDSLLNDEEFEVIGNIYENPELLKTK